MASVWNWYIYFIFIYLIFYISFSLKNFGTDETTKSIKKNKEETTKHIKESILIGEIANQDIENKAKNVKGLEEAVEVSNEVEKIIKSNKYFLLWLA